MCWDVHDTGGGVSGCSRVSRHSTAGAGVLEDIPVVDHHHQPCLVIIW